MPATATSVSSIFAVATGFPSVPATTGFPGVPASKTCCNPYSPVLCAVKHA